MLAYKKANIFFVCKFFCIIFAQIKKIIMAYFKKEIDELGIRLLASVKASAKKIINRYGGSLYHFYNTKIGRIDTIDNDSITMYTENSTDTKTTFFHEMNIYELYLINEHFEDIVSKICQS